MVSTTGISNLRHLPIRLLPQACIGGYTAHPNSLRRDFRLNDAMRGIVITLSVEGMPRRGGTEGLQPLNAWHHQNVKGHSHPLLYLQFTFKRSNAISETVQAIVGDSYEKDAVCAAPHC